MSLFITYDNILYPIGYFVNPYFYFSPYMFAKQKVKPYSIGFHLPLNLEIENEKYQYTTRSGNTVPYNLKPPSTFFTLYPFSINIRAATYPLIPS